MAIVQKGDQLDIGISGFTVSGAIVETATEDVTGDIEYVRDEDNDTKTALISDPGVRITISAIAKTGFAWTPKKGDAITLNGVTALVEEFKQERSRTAAKISITAFKPDSLSVS